jgi:hypothetical protein
MFYRYIIHRLALGLVLLLAACGPSATPQLIGTYPRGDNPPPPGAPFPGRLIVYNARLTLDVGDVDSAAAHATQLASDYGGYLVDSQAWYQGERKYAALTLAVPVPHFDSLRQALLGLGTLVSESISGEPKPINASDWNTYSTITLHLQSAAPALRLEWPQWPTWGWSPVRTFTQAFGVFFALFAWLVDALIWIAVVIGPFVLMGLGVRVLVRRLRRQG